MPETTQTKMHVLSREKLRIRNFPSAWALKEEIRNIIRDRARADWDFCSLKNCGPYLSLVFKQQQRLPRRQAATGDLR